MNTHVILNRLESNENQTLGILNVISDGKEVLQLVTQELPFKNNERKVSCIFAGTYKCKKREATANIPYPHIILLDVKDRDGICIHRVNYVKDLRGCIGVGLELKDINGDGLADTTSSKLALDKLMNVLPNEFNLTIK